MPFESDTSEDMVAELSVIIQRRARPRGASGRARNARRSLLLHAAHAARERAHT